MALAVRECDDGTWVLDSIWDSREDPEGFLFTEGVIDPVKVDRVASEWHEKAHIRFEKFGSVIQLR